ncbi:MAG: hypothetical protein Q7R40_19300 [Phaeospirillum sp.]|nr:hypothetical protein [Phaeospirillum sp.]
MDDLSSLPSFLQPRLRLFFGVDLVGSTSFKQKGEFPLKNPSESDFRQLGAQWFSGIAGFYRTVEQQFSAAWDDCRKAYSKVLKSELLITPKLWKTNGDELIYEVEITEPTDVAYVLAAWTLALKSYRPALKPSGLDLKATAWLAGFPIGNAEVVFCSDINTIKNISQDEDPKIMHFTLLEQWYKPDADRSGLVKDYVGPAVDTGFRLSGHSSHRKFVVSLEVALMLALAPPHQKFFKEFGIDKEALKLAFDQPQVMKGVIGGKPYPVFWIDMLCQDEMTKAFNEISPANKPDDGKIKNYCQSFIDEHGSYLLHPFIVNCKSQHFSNPPDNYMETLAKLASRWAEEKSRLNVRWESFFNDKSPRDDDGDIIESVDDSISNNLLN